MSLGNLRGEGLGQSGAIGGVDEWTSTWHTVHRPRRSVRVRPMLLCTV